MPNQKTKIGLIDTKQDPHIRRFTRDPLGRTHRSKVKGRKDILRVKRDQKKARVAIFISDKIDSKIKDK